MQLDVNVRPPIASSPTCFPLPSSVSLLTPCLPFHSSLHLSEATLCSLRSGQVGRFPPDRTSCDSVRVFMPFESSRALLPWGGGGEFLCSSSSCDGQETRFPSPSSLCYCVPTLLIILHLCLCLPWTISSEPQRVDVVAVFTTDLSTSGTSLPAPLSGRSRSPMFLCDASSSSPARTGSSLVSQDGLLSCFGSWLMG